MRTRVDLSYALVWMIGTSAVFGLARSARQLRIGIRGWFWVYLALLATVALGVAFHWQDVGYAAFSLWLAFVVLPETAARRARLAASQQQWQRATFWAWIVAATHPFDGQLEQARLITSQRHFQAGDTDAAKGALYPLLRKEIWAERAKVELLRLDERWDLIADHVRTQPVGSRDLLLAPIYLRAFGELGDLEAMWTMYRQLPAAFARDASLRLLMASYSGLVGAVDVILESRGSMLQPLGAAVIRATAAYTHGDARHAEELLGTFTRHDVVGSIHVRRRLMRPLRRANTTTLSAENLEALHGLERDVHLELVTTREREVPQRAWLTIALVVAMVGAYLITIPGGTTDPENLIRLGALVVPSELTEGGTAWRIFAAGFLHLGATHLAMNCLGLLVLGGQIERIWNGRVMLAVFLVSSVGSFGFAAAITQASLDDPRIFLGASSGVLGLVGAFGAFLAVGYFGHQQKAMGQRFLLVLAVVAAQFVFDWFTPIVSSMLHLTGLVIGTSTALPISVVSWRQRAVGK